MNYGPYPALVTDWHDGDTCHMEIDLGFGMFVRGHDLDGKPLYSCRVWGIDAPELSTPAGKVALQGAELLCPPGSRVNVLSHSFDKYGGRFDGTITLPDGSDFAGRMIALGYATPMPR